VKASDEAAFCELYLAHRADLRRTAHLLCGDWHLAEDLVQAAFTRLYVAWPRVHEAESLHAYVRKVLVHLFVDDKRLRRRRDTITNDLPDVIVELPPDTAGRLMLLTGVDPLSRTPRYYGPGLGRSCLCSVSCFELCG
jgi:DNA-directed RNA polymerase specialized sigma24 family protein